VVTANKTLIARCGAELREAARATETPLLYEAAVLAGVPFLGTFARRPHAASATGLVGIVNGTTNFILSQCAAGRSAAAALADAQLLGYAEPDARQDLAGIDAAEKLAVLLQHFAGRDIHPDRLETTGIGPLDALHLAHAAELGGVIKPVILAEWTSGVDAFAGAAFVPAEHPLARVDGVENALVLNTPHGRVLLQGPGAGPDATAATVLDDVHEIAGGGGTPLARAVTATSVSAPATGWMVSLSASHLPSASEVADFLASFGVFAHRSTATRLHAERRVRSFLAWPTERPRLEQALASLERACGCDTLALRALEAAV
jgi:homoserine dehydrogenase